MTRTALVTGGGSGIGRAICTRLGAEGRRVLVSDINMSGAAETADGILANGGDALGLYLDITDTEAVTSTIAQYGPVEILVNSAGWDELMPFTQTDEEFWNQVIDINFTGTLRTTHACLPQMMEQGWGRIINISSDAARVGSSLEAVYAGAKGAVISFTKTIAREVARRGITANVVCPGPTDTPLLDQIVSAGDNADRVIDAMTRAVPMKRLGQPEEVAAAVAYFAADDAGFVTGQVLSVSGGLTMA